MDSYCTALLLNNYSGGLNDHWRRIVEELIHRTQDNNVHLNNSQKADLLKSVLQVMFGNDSFYVIVFNDCDNGPKFSYDGNSNQIICSMQRGLCNVIVYRSRNWKQICLNDKSQIKNQVEECRNGVVPWWADYRGFPGILRNDHIGNTGFVGLINKDQNAQVRSVNCQEDGPGYWITARNKAGEEFILVAGFE